MLAPASFFTEFGPLHWVLIVVLVVLIVFWVQYRKRQM